MVPSCGDLLHKTKYFMSCNKVYVTEPTVPQGKIKLNVVNIKPKLC